jgi:bifunctional non-homologous end joining protein LigD
VPTTPTDPKLWPSTEVEPLDVGEHRLAGIALTARRRIGATDPTLCGMGDPSARLPATLIPMRAVLGDPPDASDDQWAYEVKWDGVRAIGFIEGGHLRLQSSNRIDITRRYPELAAVVDDLGGHTVILDGEIVTFNDAGRPDFGLLQRRMHVNDARAIGALMAEHPVVWVVFDLLHLDGHDLYCEAPGTAHQRGNVVPYEQRRRLLEDLVENGPNWQVPVAQYGDSQVLLEAVSKLGMEGLLAKRWGSPYEAGRRSANWRKLKIRRRQEFVVGGWRPGESGRAGTIGALLVGYYAPDGRLTYAGRVGSGLNAADLTRLPALFATMARPTCPFDPPPTRDESRDAHWLEPQMVVDVAFGEWSHDQRLRHPSYVGERLDKAPRDVVREDEPA